MHAEVLVVGGSAMALAYSRERVTRDVDAVFEPKATVYDEARRMADELGLPPDWLNDGVKGLLPDVGDDRARDRARSVTSQLVLQVLFDPPLAGA